MPLNTVGTLVAISLAATFFITPLVLKYHVYKPTKRAVVMGDIILLDKQLSTFWCQGVHFSSASKFEVYVYDTYPDIDLNVTERTSSKLRTVLPNKAQEYWGLHLLRGSKVNISACARLIGGDVTVVKSHHGLMQCLNEHKHNLRERETSGEDSLSESESDEDTSSISSSQGAIMNDTEFLYECKNKLAYDKLPPSYRCSQLSHDFPTAHVLTIDIDETGYYYFIFSSRTYLEIIPNEFFINFIIDRTDFNHSSSSSHCSSNLTCDVDLLLRGDQDIVVHMNGTDSILRSEDLLVACKPREWIFFSFYAAFFLVIFICAFQ